jgi:hypothetical protein
MFSVGLKVSQPCETIFLIGLEVSQRCEREKADDLRLSQPRKSIFFTCLRVLGVCEVVRPCGARSGTVHFASKNGA